MIDKKHANKTKLFLLGLLCVALVIGLYLFHAHVLEANKTISPTNEYRVSYNRITKIITMQQLGTDIKGYDSNCYDPSFLWSSDGRYLARNITAPDGNRRAEIANLMHSSVSTTLTKSAIQEMYPETQTQNQDRYECIEITKWLGNTDVLIEFSWPADVPGENITGWCVYDFSTRRVQELSLEA